ncbi:hypothetical protein WCP94_002682 [Bilophila wadsworthia]
MRLLYLSTRPCKALPAPKPLRSLQIRYVLRPSGKNSPYVQKLRAPSCLRPNLRHEDAAFIREAYDLRAALFFPAHRMYAPPLAAPKGPAFRDHLPASNPPPSRFSRLYTIPCRYSPWHKAETHRLDNRTGLAARPSRGRGISEVTARSCGDSPSPFWKLLYEWFSYIAGCVPSCLFTYCPLEAGDISINDPGCSAC